MLNYKNIGYIAYAISALLCIVIFIIIISLGLYVFVIEKEELYEMFLMYSISVFLFITGALFLVVTLRALYLSLKEEIRL